MEGHAPRKIPSGIEPIDKVLGGLDGGRLYLVHGDYDAASFFGIRFLAEGLRRGETGALVIRSSPGEAVRQFARLGYDCLEDVYGGRLVILESSQQISRQLSKNLDIAPLLRELEWLLGNSRPDRLVIDPITDFVGGEANLITQRVPEFVDWAAGFGATLICVASDEEIPVVESFKPAAQGLFRFDSSRGAGETTDRTLVFEKPNLTACPVEVDPARGIFLSQNPAPSDREPPIDATLEPEASGPSGSAEPFIELSGLWEIGDVERAEGGVVLDIDLGNNMVFPHERVKRPEAPEVDIVAEPQPPLEHPKAEVHLTTSPESRIGGDDLSYLFDDLSGAAVPFGLDEFDLAEPGGKTDAELEDAASRRLAEETTRGEPTAGKTEIDSVMMASVTDSLLSAPDGEMPTHPEETDRLRATVRESAPIESDLRESSPANYNVLIIADDATARDIIAHCLADYNVETVRDGLTGLAKLISFKPDLVVLDVDLPVIDGFKILTHIRSSLNVPIIAVSGSHVRQSDRILSTELGADYYLTKPFAVRELRNKARQLIGRYRGIREWVVQPVDQYVAKDEPTRPTVKTAAREPEERVRSERTSVERFVPYQGFAARVEQSVAEALDTGAPFSIVGCRLSQAGGRGGRSAIRLAELVTSLTRETDLISSNPRNDLMVYLAEADAAGAHAFTQRMRERVRNEMSFEPSVWIRSFPKMDVKTGEVPARPRQEPPPGQVPRRRARDQAGR